MKEQHIAVAGSPPETLEVLALEPYFGLSHRTFLEGYRRYSRHRVAIWSLPPRKWKWRMRGAAYLFASRAAEMPPADVPHVVLASDFLNLADWRAVAPRPWRDVPVVAYFHENQLTYPLSEAAPADFHHGWINLSTALAADAVLFNSRFHRESFLDAVGLALAKMPDHVPPGLVERLERLSDVFPVGVDFEPHRAAFARRPRDPGATGFPSSPLLLWNHRWEHDKGPDLLAAALLELRAKGVRFRLALCGESSQPPPAEFEALRTRLDDDIVQFGFCASRDEYLDLVARADVVLSTARHDFFGVAVLEAIYLGCLPALPRDLSYPEIVPEALHDRLLYESGRNLAAWLRRFLREPPLAARGTLREAAARFDWKVLAPRLDAILGETAARGRR